MGLLSWLTFGNSVDPALTMPGNFYGRYDFTGGSVADLSGNGNDGHLNPFYTLTADRKGAANNAYTFDGTEGYVYTTTSFTNPSTFSINAWFKTTTTSGGLLVGFANTQINSMTSFDRLLYMGTDSKLYFGVYDGASTHIITSTSTYNDGNWHMATAVMNPTTGMKLYVDNSSAGTDPNTVCQNYTGWWHIAFSSTAGWTNAADFFGGTLDDIWIYNIALTSSQVTQLYGL